MINKMIQIGKSDTKIQKEVLLKGTDEPQIQNMDDWNANHANKRYQWVKWEYVLPNPLEGTYSRIIINRRLIQKSLDIFCQGLESLLIFNLI